MDILERIEIQEMIQETKEFMEDDELEMEEIFELTGWTDKSVKKFGKTIGHAPTKKGFFNKCYARMEGKFGEDGAKRFCASIKDKAHGTTYWRGKGKKKVGPVDKGNKK